MNSLLAAVAPIYIPVHTSYYSGGHSNLTGMQALVLLIAALHFFQVVFTVLSVSIERDSPRSWRTFQSRGQILRHLFIPLWFVVSIGWYFLKSLKNDYRD